jgi:hypothetical protein
MAAPDPKLGPKVSTREYSWMDMVIRAWGGEYYAPDHGVYDFRGRKFDSTDKTHSGIYNDNLGPAVSTGTGSGAPAPAPATIPVIVNFGTVHKYPALKTKVGFSQNANNLDGTLQGAMALISALGISAFTVNCEFDTWFKNGGTVHNPLMDSTYDGSGRAITMSTTPTSVGPAWAASLQSYAIICCIQLTGATPAYQLTTTYEPRRHPPPNDVTADRAIVSSWINYTNWNVPIVWVLWNEGGRTMYDCKQGYDLNNNPIVETTEEYYLRREGLKEQSGVMLGQLLGGTFTTTGGYSIGPYSQIASTTLLAGDTNTSNGRSDTQGNDFRHVFWSNYNTTLAADSTIPKSAYAAYNDFADKNSIRGGNSDYQGFNGPIWYTQGGPYQLGASDSEGGGSNPGSTLRMPAICERMTMMLTDLERPEVAMRCQSYVVGSGKDSFINLTGGIYTVNAAYTALSWFLRVPQRRVTVDGVQQSPDADKGLWQQQGLLGLAGVDTAGTYGAILLWNEGPSDILVQIALNDLPTAIQSAAITHTYMDEAHLTGISATVKSLNLTIGAGSVHLIEVGSATAINDRRSPFADGTYTPLFLNRTEQHQRPKDAFATFDQVHGTAYLMPVLTYGGTLKTTTTWSNLPDNLWATLWVWDADFMDRAVVISADYGSGTVPLLSTTLGAIAQGQVTQLGLAAAAPVGWSGGTRTATLSISITGTSQCHVECWISGTLAKASALVH